MLAKNWVEGATCAATASLMLFRRSEAANLTGPRKTAGHAFANPGCWRSTSDADGGLTGRPLARLGMEAPKTPQTSAAGAQPPASGASRMGGWATRQSAGEASISGPQEQLHCIGDGACDVRRSTAKRTSRAVARFARSRKAMTSQAGARNTGEQTRRAGGAQKDRLCHKDMGGDPGLLGTLYAPTYVHVPTSIVIGPAQQELFFGCPQETRRQRERPRDSVIAKPPSGLGTHGSRSIPYTPPNA